MAKSNCKHLKKIASKSFKRFEKLENIIDNTKSKTKRITLQKKADKIYDNYMKYYTKAGRCENKQTGKIVKLVSKVS